jgi:outer membrane protein assembly factor BamB
MDGRYLESAFAMKTYRVVWVTLIAGFLLCGCPTGWCGDWPTFGHDPQRSGWAVGEDAFNVRNVSRLALLWKVKVKNQALSLTALTAPVVADGVDTPSGLSDVVYVAGSSDNLTAIDAESGKIIWTRAFERHVLPEHPGMWLCPNNLNATPVIDRRHGLIDVIASDGTFYGLDLSSGRIKLGPVQFVPPFSKNWSLNLWNGIVYTSISQGCGEARSGIYSIDFRHPERPTIRDLLVSKTGSAGIWGRGGVAIGDDGGVYAATGDGNFNPSQSEYGSSFIAANLKNLKVVDYYSPLNYEQLTRYDLDIAASSVIWFPYRDYSLVAGGGKEGVLYLLNADSLGTRDHQTPLDRQKLANDALQYEALGIWGELSSWMDTSGNRWLYVPIWGPLSKLAPQFPLTNGSHLHGSLTAFKVVINLSTKKPELDPAWISGDFDVPEPVAIANGVIFALSTGENTQQTVGSAVIYHGQRTLTDEQRSEHTRHAVLYALDATTGKVLYQSGDAMSSWVHFSGLAVADGRIYAVDHSSTVYCFGLASH